MPTGQDANKIEVPRLFKGSPLWSAHASQTMLAKRHVKPAPLRPAATTNPAQLVHAHQQFCKEVKGGNQMLKCPCKHAQVRSSIMLTAGGVEIAALV